MDWVWALVFYYIVNTLEGKIKVASNKKDWVSLLFRDRGTDFISVKHKIFLFSIKISYCKNPLLEGPNLGEARASVLHRFRGAWPCIIFSFF